MTRRTREAMASELKLPQYYVELDQQEMMYVDGGGIYVSNEMIGTFMLAAGGCGAKVWGTAWAMKGVLAGKVIAFFSWMWGIPFVGPLLAIYVGAQALSVAACFIEAFFSKKGVDFSLAWYGLKTRVK